MPTISLPKDLVEEALKQKYPKQGTKTKATKKTQADKTIQLFDEIARALEPFIDPRKAPKGKEQVFAKLGVKLQSYIEGQLGSTSASATVATSQRDYRISEEVKDIFLELSPGRNQRKINQVVAFIMISGLTEGSKTLEEKISDLPFAEGFSREDIYGPAPETDPEKIESRLKLIHRKIIQTSSPITPSDIVELDRCNRTVNLGGPLETIRKDEQIAPVFDKWARNIHIVAERKGSELSREQLNQALASLVLLPELEAKLDSLEQQKFTLLSTEHGNQGQK
jgi:hypothetical protein